MRILADHSQVMLHSFITPAAIMCCLCASAQTTYAYESVPNDPLEARIYTLGNGMRVYLSRNTDAPRVQTHIAVRAGSKHDPADATGLAHYLEHMLFKGTSKIGTADWAKERALLEQISDLYEKRRGTQDEAERTRIYRRIDSLSTLAAAAAVPNEYDKMVKSLGARGTNANTNSERTLYVNDIPSDELERWMSIESERFKECVLRLFHTELETVYEEFNRGQDNDGRNAYAKLSSMLFPSHPYGTQTTIGTGEHLKNPSMEKIHTYFSTYYVPNNMAVVLSGDIDYDRTIAMVDKYFGQYQRKDVPAFTFTQQPEITQPIVGEVFGPAAEWLDMAWRFGGYTSGEGLMLELIDGLLNNGKAGIMDLDLLQAQKVLDASSAALLLTDYSMFYLHGEPKEGQTLDQVRELLLSQIEKLKNGDFDEGMIQAVVDNMRIDRMRTWNESNSLRASAMTDAFVQYKKWNDVVDRFDRMEKITKEQVLEFARKHFNLNYVCLYKRTGVNKDAYKVSKPPITPLDIKRDGISAWRKEWEKMPPAKLEPVFVDFRTAIARTALNSGVELATVKNPANDLFSLYYILDMGTDHDQELQTTLDYLPYLGTSRYSPVDLRKELYRKGLTLTVSCSRDRAYVMLSGLEKNLAEGVALLEHVLADARPDAQALKGLVADVRKARQDRMKDKNVLLQEALFNLARYGERSPFNDVLSDTQLAALRSEDLAERIHTLTSYEHRVFYYGRKDAAEVAKLLKEKHRVPAKLKELPAERAYPEIATTTNQVFFVEHDMVQTEMLLVSKAGAFDAEKMPYASLFSEYFGGGLSSIVFQEIREAKALAYSANVTYTIPAERSEAHYVRAFLGTQTDKLADAVSATLKLMNDMPMAREQFEGAKASALKVIASTRITKENIYWRWDDAQRRGLDFDVRRMNYERIPNITIEDMKVFFDKEVKGRPYSYCVIGKEAALDMKALEQMGPVRKVSKAELFGYAQEP
jgi:zinc protease